MDFFGQQAQAQQQTRRLIVLFALALVAIVGAVNLAMILVLMVTRGVLPLRGLGFPHYFFLTNTAVTLLLICGGTAVEVLRLREGGDAVARMAGGTLVPPAARNPGQRRLLNVVEEMAIAAGIACPRVYVLERETTINAFAAGFNQNEAVIAVTRGALQRLTRDELQGVVGHEFSHILNGDMRLNIRLIGVLFGLQMLHGFGQYLMGDPSDDEEGVPRGADSRRSARGGLWYTAGIALSAVGYIGIFFGRLIKAAVSRQREFLADASAVQFTRNPDGIGGALRKIGGLTRSTGLGSRIDHPNAEHLSHLFLGAARPALAEGWLATHPPLTERLRRIYGLPVAYLDPLPLPETDSADAVTPRLPDIPYFTQLGPVPGPLLEDAAAAEAEDAAAVAAVADARQAPAPAPGTERSSALQPLPEALQAAVRDFWVAPALVYALLMDDPLQFAAQLAILRQRVPKQALQVPALRQVLDSLPPGIRLPLLDLAMPALKQANSLERAALLATVNVLLENDQRITLPEFVLQTILARRLDPNAGRMVPIRFASLSQLPEDCALLLSLVAHVGAEAAGSDAPALATARFAGVAARAVGDGLPALGLVAAAEIHLDDVRRALDRCNQLAPLAKPALIKLMVDAAGPVATPALQGADLLRALCTAIDAPLPPAVQAAYAGYRWQGMATSP